MGYCRNASSRARKTCSRPTLTASVGSSVWTCSQPYLRFGWVTFQNHVHSFKSSASSNPWFRGLFWEHDTLRIPPGCSSGCFQRPHWYNRMGRLWNSSSVKVELASCDKLLDKNPAPTPWTNLPWKIQCVKSFKIIYSTNLDPLCKTWTWLIFRMDGDTRCWNTQVAPHFLPQKRHRFFSPLTSPKGPWIATFHCAWHFGLRRLWFRIGGPQSGYGVVLLGIPWFVQQWTIQNYQIWIIKYYK